MIRKLFFGILTLLLFGCEKDDICSDTNANTPHLIIEFYDISNTTEKKSVDNLLIIGVGNTLSYGSALTRDEISIPLKVLENNTQYQLIKDYTIDTNGTPDDTSDDIVTGNSDIITITYENEQVYISRACGFKNIFNNTAIGFSNDGDNWILNTEVVQTTIENEENAHIYIYH